MSNLTDKTIDMSAGCGCCAECCPSRGCPLPDNPGAINPLPLTLTVELTATFPLPPSSGTPPLGFTDPPPSDCYSFSFTVHLISCYNPDAPFRMPIHYAGNGSEACTWCGRDYVVHANVVVICGDSGDWFLTIEEPGLFVRSDCGRDFSGGDFSITMRGTSCDPIFATGDINQCIDCFWQCNIGAFEISPGVLVPVVVSHPPFCLTATIYETP